jgi:SM-20-related protein
MTPLLLDNFFPAELYDRLRATVREAPMSYGSKSNRNTDPHGHWSWKPIHDSTHNLADLSDLLNSTHNLWATNEGWKFLRINRCNDMKLVRCYANGYTYGTDGYFHTDSERAGDLTVIIYICDDWPMDWAGETVCTDGKTYWSYLPRPNRVVILPSDMLHAARAVSRKCTSLRTTLMYKARPARSETFEHQSAWLRDHGALAIKHATGSLHDHLMRCHQLLDDRKTTPPFSCLWTAGGLHSIYGTNAFAKVLVEPTESNRAEVADAFGKAAEELAYLFHLIDRPKTLDREIREGMDVAYRFAANGFIPNEKFRALQLIECANLADQNKLAGWPNLAKLWKGKSDAAASVSSGL